MQRFGTAEEVAQAVTWLCSEAASYITHQKICLPRDGRLPIFKDQMAVRRKFVVKIVHHIQGMTSGVSDEPNAFRIRTIQKKNRLASHVISTLLFLP